jgi:type II secretory pathway predicted ATPase ExeA
MLALKQVLTDHGISQAALAREVGLDSSTINVLLNHEKWPVNPPRAALQAAIEAALTAKGVAVTSAMFEPAVSVDAEPADCSTGQSIAQHQEIDMLLRKQTLSPQARKHFGLFRDPFSDDVQKADDVFTSPDIRYVREYLWSTAKLGGFLAIVGESGAGKTTLLDDLKDRIFRESASIVVIEPSVRRMEDNDKKGKTLKSGDIEEAIIYSLDSSASPKRSAEARARQVKEMLEHSTRDGNAHVLIIEEAHALPLPTLKHLKRFREIKIGHRILLNILLIGQTELKIKLSSHSPEVREVVQRCEVVELPPLDARLEEYLRFKFERVGKPAAEIFEADAMDGIRARLVFAKSSKDRRETASLLYPLMVNNLVTAALNLAATLGLPKINADLVREV